MWLGWVGLVLFYDQSPSTSDDTHTSSRTARHLIPSIVSAVCVQLSYLDSMDWLSYSISIYLWIQSQNGCILMDRATGRTCRTLMRSWPVNPVGGRRSISCFSCLCSRREISSTIAPTHAIRQFRLGFPVLQLSSSTEKTKKTKEKWMMIFDIINESLFLNLTAR